MNGSSNSQGSGVRIVTIRPNGVEISYTLRFKFKASNNEAEYKALIAGLKMTKSLGVERLKVNSDS